MLETAKFVQNLMEEYPPTALGIEKVFFAHQNQANAEFVWGLRGIVLFLAEGAQIFEYSPSELKKFITGNGKASKLLVQQMIKKIFGLAQMPEFDDAADALGLAYLAFKAFK